MNKILREVFDVFLPQEEFASFKEITSGHINDTFLVTAIQKRQYIFQKINKGVFNDVPGLIMNKVNISKHLHKKLFNLTQEERQRRVLTFLQNPKGENFYLDQNGDFWNVTLFIDNSQTFETVTEVRVAYEGGKLFGEFTRLTQDFDTGNLVEVIPRFHDMAFRFGQFEDSLKRASAERLLKAKSYIQIVNDLKAEMHILQHLKDQGKIKIRVTHNDTKISNALFDMEGKGLCVIDTDTIMPGIIHYDFGDAIRTICNTAAEDEKDLKKVMFNKEFYEAYTQGFLEEVGDAVSEFERNYFPLAAKTMIFIMALRFLTDYLNNDIYYKTRYPEHNLIRSMNQFKLIQSFEEVMGS